jgi:F-type H+-transporting ATPase subunit a
MAVETLDELGLPHITATAVTACIVAALLLLFALVLRIFFIPRWRGKRAPGPLQSVLEMIIGLFDKEGREAIGHNAKYLAPWYIGVCGLILFGTLSELFGVRPPLTDINVTFALGLSTFVFMVVFGFKEKKLKYLGRYKIGIPLVTDMVVPVSMGLRLFGSVFSGYVIMHLLDGFLWGFLGYGSIALSPILAVASVVTTLFHAFIQSYVFMMLSFAFVGETTE